MNNQNNDLNKQFINSFIFSAIADVAETIRFTDAKVGVTFALYGLIINALVIARENIHEAIKMIFDFSLCYGIIYLLLIIFTFICIAISVFYLVFTITPRKSIEEYLTNGMSEPQKQMWLVKLNKHESILNILNRLRNKNKYPLNITLDDYYENIVKQDENSLIKGEALELLKLSFIRNKKIDCFNNGLLWFRLFLLFVAIVGVITIIVNVKWMEIINKAY